MNPKDVKIILSEIIDLKEFLYSANTKHFYVPGTGQVL